MPTAVVSNIGWDPRPVLDRWAVRDLIDELVLSDEVGLLKPDPAIFRLACARLGVDPAVTVMVGDNPDADGGAVAAGCRFVLVPRPTRRSGNRAPCVVPWGSGLTPAASLTACCRR